MVVLDASAMLALIAAEPGDDVVARHLPGAIMSAANVAEVVVKHVDRGVEADGVVDDLHALGISIEPVDAEDAMSHAAIRTHELQQRDQRPRLSLGDRFCLALAHRRGVPALTADRAWAEMGLPVDVVLIR